MARTARIELRAEPHRAARLRRAAEMSHQSVTDFVLDAAEQRAEEILISAAVTVVPAEFFDQLYAALDAPAEDNPSLAALAGRPRSFEQR